MQEVKTEGEKIVDIYPYKMSISEIPGFPRRIIVAIRQFNGDFVEGDERAIESIFQDIGKWEAFSSTASILLTELGVVRSQVSTSPLVYSSDRFKFERDKSPLGTALRRYYMHMDVEERHRRETTEIPWPTSKEIALLIENVKKWKSLTQTAKLFQNTFAISG